MKKIGPSAYAAGLLALLGYLELGCATDPNQAGPSHSQDNPEGHPVAPGTIRGITEWLSIHQRLFSRNTGPANALSVEVVLALIQRMAVLETSQEFKLVCRCVENVTNLDIVRQMAETQGCLTQIDGFLEALQERAQLESTIRELRLVGEGQSVMEQLANLPRLDREHVCHIQSLTRVRDLLVLYQQWANLHRYIWLQLGNRRDFCLTLFASTLASGINQLRAREPIFQLLQNFQFRLGEAYNQQGPPFVHIREISPGALYDAVANEMGAINQRYPSNIVPEIQRVVVRELRRICNLVVPNNVVSYYNQFMPLLGFVRLKPITMINLSTTTVHLPKFEICSMILNQNYPISRALDEIDQMNLYGPQMAVALPGEATQGPSLDQTQSLMPSQNVNQAIGQPVQVNTMPFPESPRVENEEDFYETLASAVADNYQRDSGIGPSGSHDDSDHDQI